jgi:MFS family permease
MPVFAYFARLFGGFPRVFWWLWLSTLIAWLGRFVVPFMAIYLTRHLGFSAGQTGLMLALFGLGGVISALAGGVIADLAGRKRTIVFSHVLSGGTMLLFTWADSTVIIGSLLFLLGLVNGAAEPATRTMIAEILPKADLQRGYAANSWALNLGYALGPIIGGVLVEFSFTLIFGVNALATAATAAIILFMIPSDAETIAARRLDGASSIRLRDVFRDYLFIAFVFLGLMFALVYRQGTTSLPIIMSEQGFPASAYAMLLTTNGLLMIALQMPVNDWISHLSRGVLLAISALVVGAGFGSYIFAELLWVYVVGVVIWTIGEVVNMPVATAVAADLAPAHARGTYMGVFSGIWGSAGMIAPLMSGYVLETFGSQILWGGCVALGIACFVGRLAMAPALDRRLRQG